MSAYETLADEELISLSRKGQQEVTEFIMEKYKNLVRKRANAMYLIGGETEDLIQEGMIGLFRAVRDYKEDRGSSFYHFADICILRQIYHAVEAAGRKKHQPLNSYVSLSAEDEETGLTLSDMLIALDGESPEQLFIDRENVTAMTQALNRSLSSMEKQIIGYHLEGISYRQIAEIMGKSPKAIDNALQRIKGKLKEYRK
ncbi:RNA polymerase factor sigma-70 [Clostridia bacterium]|nr:RNA polymerase factor sigma-70 [Clostridia bacterium]